MKISDIKIPGIHNQQNCLVAIAISKLMGADDSDIQYALSTFYWCYTPSAICNDLQ